MRPRLLLIGSLAGAYIGPAQRLYQKFLRSGKARQTIPLGPVIIRFKVGKIMIIDLTTRYFYLLQQGSQFGIDFDSDVATPFPDTSELLPSSIDVFVSMIGEIFNFPGRLSIDQKSGDSDLGLIRTITFLAEIPNLPAESDVFGPIPGVLGTIDLRGWQRDYDQHIIYIFKTYYSRTHSPSLEQSSAQYKIVKVVEDAVMPQHELNGSGYFDVDISRFIKIVGCKTWTLIDADPVDDRALVYVVDGTALSESVQELVVDPDDDTKLKLVPYLPDGATVLPVLPSGSIAITRMPRVVSFDGPLYDEYAVKYVLIYFYGLPLTNPSTPNIYVPACSINGMTYYDASTAAAYATPEEAAAADLIVRQDLPYEYLQIYKADSYGKVDKYSKADMTLVDTFSLVATGPDTAFQGTPSGFVATQQGGSIADTLTGSEYNFSKIVPIGGGVLTGTGVEYPILIGYLFTQANYVPSVDFLACITFPVVLWLTKDGTPTLDGIDGILLQITKERQSDGTLADFVPDSGTDLGDGFHLWPYKRPLPMMCIFGNCIADETTVMTTLQPYGFDGAGFGTWGSSLTYAVSVQIIDSLPVLILEKSVDSSLTLLLNNL